MKEGRIEMILDEATGRFTGLFRTILPPAKRPKGVAGYKDADRAERGMRRLSRNVKEAQAKEKGLAYSATKPPKRGVRCR